MVGSGLGLSSLTTGSLVSWGNSALARSTASRTSATICLILSATSNSAVITTKLSLAVAVISSKPSRVLSSFSIGRTSNLAPSSGEMPSCRTIIITTGRVTFGLSSTGIEKREPAPASTIRSIIDSVALEWSTTKLRNFIRASDSDYFLSLLAGNAGSTCSPSII